MDSETPSEVSGVTTTAFNSLIDVADQKYLSPQTTIDPKEDVWLVPFSSGTTGLPKGVALTHYNMIANIWQFVPYSSLFNVSKDNTIVGILPMYHIYGLYCFALATPMQGGNMILMPGFEPVKFLESIQTYSATHVHIVPPLALFLAKDPRVKDYNLSSLQDIVSAAAPLAGDVAAFTSEQLRTMGVKDASIRQAWGMTELSPVATSVRYELADKCYGGVGDPVAFTEVKLADSESGETVPIGAEGEVWVRGPQVMKGYFKNEQATAETITKDGWLRTGDIAMFDPKLGGNLRITERLKELIKTKGFQVAPAELEGILLTHPAIQDVCVFGLPHEKLGEAPAAAVVLKPNQSLDENKVKEFVAAKTAPYKHLAGGVSFIDIIPKTASGKILRRVLRTRYMK